MTISQAIADLVALEADPSLFDEEALGKRVDALEQLDFACQVFHAAGPRASNYEARAVSLRRRLVQVNASYYGRLRRWLRSGSATTEEIRTLLMRHSTYGRPDGPRLHLGYEPADALVDGVLELDRFQGSPTVQHPELVHLEDTPVRVLLDLAEHITLEQGERLCDLGSGLGRAAVVLRWLTGATVHGIEIQPDYCAFAILLARSFGLANVSFEQGDARSADLSRGDVFYMFTPFKGGILRAVLERLRAEATRRPITLCTYGSVSLVAGQEPWLRLVEGRQPHEFALAIWRSVQG